MRIIVGPKKGYYLTKLIVNIWSLHWEYQLQINFSVQRLELMLCWVSCDGSVMENICMSYYIYFIWLVWLFVNMLLIFVLCLVNIVNATNVIAQLNSISMLNGTNFKVWKEAVEIILGYMDLDLALRTKWSISTLKTSNKVKIEKWDRSNRMCLMIMKRSISEPFRDSIF